jgi:hypothetical protein
MLVQAVSFSKQEKSIGIKQILNGNCHADRKGKAENIGEKLSMKKIKMIGAGWSNSNYLPSKYEALIKSHNHQ